jgi:hypothetical protein
MLRTLSRLPLVFLAGALALFAGCGGEGTTSPLATKLSQQQAQTVAVSLFDEVARAMANLSFAPSSDRVSFLRSGMPTVTVSSSCAAGGKLDGSLTYTDNTNSAGTGTVSGSMTINIVNCGVSTGSGSIAVNGRMAFTFSVSFLRGVQSSDFVFQGSGNFTWTGGEPCSFNYTVKIAPNGNGTIKGEMCGESVSESF